MKRKKFIQLSALTSLGALFSPDMLAKISERKPMIVDISAPNIHVRHGMFNLQSLSDAHEDFYIRRDVFSRSGLENVASDRITSIKMKLNSKEIFAIVGENCDSSCKSFTAQLLRYETYELIKVVHPSIVFSEFDDIIIDGRTIPKNQALVVMNPCDLEVISPSAQHVNIVEF